MLARSRRTEATMNNQLTAWAAAAVVTAPVLLGCGGGASGGLAGLPDDYEAPGTYTVPAVPAVRFPIAAVHVDQTDGTLRVYYDLPAELVPRAPRVTLIGPLDGSSTLDLSGPAGTSQCTATAGALQCREDLSGVHLDAEAAAALPPGNPQRAAVQAFIADPIGILEVTLPE
jgi:hypothetical protein